MKTHLWGNAFWPVWLGVSVGLFLAMEILALVTNAQNTLSDWVWRALRITERENIMQWSATDYLIFGVWVVLFTWLTFHFFFRKFH